MVTIDENGALQITTNIDTHHGEQFVNRQKALIRLLKNQNEDVTMNEDVATVLDMLEELTPTPEQANLMFKKPDY